MFPASELLSLSSKLRWRRRFGFVFDATFTPPDGVAEDELDLAIYTAKLLRGPTLDFPPERRLNPQQKCFSFVGGHSDNQV